MLNARGALLGLAFDGNWEAMSGDVAFEPDLQRTISVDIRYVLFIIDKYAGAGWLLDELVFEYRFRPPIIKKYAPDYAGAYFYPLLNAGRFIPAVSVLFSYGGAPL